MEVKTLPQSLAGLVDLLNDNFKLSGRLTPLRAKELVLAANVQEADMMEYADFDHPIEDCYGRKMVYENENFEVMVMSWNPGDYSSIHNHGYTQWGVVQVFGHTHHCIYRIKDNELCFTRKELLPKKTAIKVNNALIHQMGNAGSDPYMTLHVYGCNNEIENITADAKNYDLEYDRISHTTGGAFFNLPSDCIYDFEKGPQPTQSVFLHYASLLMDYYNRQIPCDEVQARKEQLLTKLEKTMLA
ncbi:MAG: cysteine dioxygenase family protein [Bacteroidota bacterium]